MDQGDIDGELLLAGPGEVAVGQSDAGKAGLATCQAVDVDVNVWRARADLLH